MLKISAKFKPWNGILTNLTSYFKYLSIKSESIFHLSSEVSASLNSGKPVVALESTIITHGMPYPDNFKTAKEVEKIVRDNGATPATIAILEGQIRIGLNSNELEKLADGKITVSKISRRDLPYMISQKLSGGTTVSATMLLAHQAGIPIFVTGGIGGVHRNAEISFDVSCDLTELGQTPVTVISSGVKSILDIPKTLEYLETKGVCVATFGEDNNFPAFFTSRSGYKSPYSLGTIEEAAKLILSSQELRLKSGILIAVPIPQELEADGSQIEIAIQEALDEAREKNVVGKEVTPFILKRVNQLTGGRSLIANIALVKNNAKIGSLVAVALNNLKKIQPKTSIPSSLNHHPPSIATSLKGDEDSGRPVIIGGSNVDFVHSLTESQLKINGGTYLGQIRQVCGGVGRNLCEALHRLGHNPIFLSAVGQDDLAEFVTARFPSCMNNIRRVVDYSTATYSAFLNDKGECMFGLADMKVHDKISHNYVSGYEDDIKRAPMVVMDGNIPVETMSYVLKICGENNIPVWFEPTDIKKAVKPFTTKLWKNLCYVSPNYEELKAIHQQITGQHAPLQNNSTETNDKLLPLLHNCWYYTQPLLHYINTVLITLGKRGIFVISQVPQHFRYPLSSTWSKQQLESKISSIYYPALPVEKLLSVSGSGDCLAAAFISGILRMKVPRLCAVSALYSARQSLASYDAVPKSLQLEHEVLQKIPLGKIYNF